METGQKNHVLKNILLLTIFPVHLWIFLSDFFSSTNISCFWLLVLLLLLSMVLNVNLWVSRKRFRKYKKLNVKEDGMKDLKALPKGFSARIQMEHQIKGLSDYNRLMVSLLNRLKQIETNAMPAQLVSIKKMRKMLVKGLEAGDEWHRFLVLFRSCELDFWTILKSRHPELKPSELRLVALFRLDLPQEEIAKLLHVSEEGVKKAVYRLRKKMAISPDIHFRQYLQEELFRTGISDPE